jgi:hypothetical protein
MVGLLFLESCGAVGGAPNGIGAIGSPIWIIIAQIGCFVNRHSAILTTFSLNFFDDFCVFFRRVPPFGLRRRKNRPPCAFSLYLY